MPEQLVVGGIVLTALIPAVVELFKSLGWFVGHERWVTGVLTLAAFALVQFTNFMPQYENYVVLGLQALLVFLGSAGFYHVGIKPLRK